MASIQYFKYSQDVFKFFGLWGRNGETQTFKTQFIRYSVVILLGCFIPIICISDTFDAAHKGDIPLSFTKALYGFAYLVCFHKLAAAAFYNDETYSCIVQLENMSLKFRNLEDFNRSLKTYKKIATMGSAANNICGVFFLAAPTVIREFPYNPHFPHLDFKKSPNYELMYVYQAIAILTVTNVMLAYDTLFCGLMSLCGAVLSSISREATEIDLNGYDDGEPEILLRDVIEKIIEISNLINKISDIFSFTTMTSILYNCSLMALGLFMVSMLPFNDLTCLAMMSVIIVEVFQLWIYCYFGQIIVNEVLKKAYALYAFLNEAR